MADTPSAVEAGLSLDDAYAAISTLEYRYSLSPLMGGHEPAAEMSPKVLFRTAEALDVVLSHGNPDQAQTAATFATELVDILPLSTETERKRAILSSVLGIQNTFRRPRSATTR
jgi:hypothetical protein